MSPRTGVRPANKHQEVLLMSCWDAQPASTTRALRLALAPAEAPRAARAPIAPIAPTAPRVAVVDVPCDAGRAAPRNAVAGCVVPGTPGALRHTNEQKLCNDVKFRALSIRTAHRRCHEERRCRCCGKASSQDNSERNRSAW